MKNKTFLLCLLLLFPATMMRGQIKVACVGNSITFGAGLPNREKNSYPAQLQVHLGSDYQVVNFGVSGRTALSKGDYPYMACEAYRNSLAFAPDIVFIKLGTNDSKAHNMKHVRDFKRDYRTLVRSYKALASKPRIILLLPIKSFLDDPASINDDRCRNTLTPIILQIAEEEGLEYIDLHGALGETYNPVLLPDRIHPSPLGDAIIAEKLYHYLKPESAEENPCAHPVCGAEYRAGAGWKEGAEWHAVNEEITRCLHQPVDLLWLGNSITQGLGGNRSLVTYRPGKAVADSIFAGWKWETAGIAGDRTQHLLWRLQHGGYAKAQPRHVVIAIGVNNILTGKYNAGQIAEGIIAVTREAERQFPDARILLHGLLPTGYQPTAHARRVCDSIHDILARQSWDKATYRNPSATFVHADGSLKAELYAGDGIHLSEKGYVAWCRLVKEAFLGPIVANFPAKAVGAFNFHGFQGTSFSDNGARFLIVAPRKAREGNPWVWRARFWGHEPQTDIELLKAGYHVAYCDVSDLFGAPQAVARWERFYHLATEAGLHAKPALEGMSRGGLIIYNWAAAHPDKVACIYADAPVMDLKSWPMGYKGRGTRSETDVPNMLKAYGFSSEKEAGKYKHNPIDHARTMAEHNIPMLHVVGDADTVVPYANNTAVFEKRLKKYGKTLQVIHKPGIGHHPHSLKDPAPIVSFIRKAVEGR